MRKSTWRSRTARTFRALSPWPRPASPRPWPMPGSTSKPHGVRRAHLRRDRRLRFHLRSLSPGASGGVRRRAGARHRHLPQRGRHWARRRAVHPLPRHLDRTPRPHRNARRETRLRRLRLQTAGLVVEEHDRPSAGRLRSRRHRRHPARHARRRGSAHHQRGRTGPQLRPGLRARHRAQAAHRARHRQLHRLRQQELRHAPAPGVKLRDNRADTMEADGRPHPQRQGLSGASLRSEKADSDSPSPSGLGRQSRARSGRRKPNFPAEPEDGGTVEGQPICFQAKADGIPHPDYEWYEVDRAGNAKGLVAQGPELAIPSPALGISRYVVRASNSAGEVISRVALLSVEAKVRLQLDRTSTPLSTPHPRGGHIRSAEQIEKNRSRLDAQKAEEMFRRRQKRKVTLGIVTSLVGLVAFAAFVLWRFGAHRQEGAHAVSAGSVPETRTLSDSFADWPPQWKDVAVGEIAAGITKKNYSDGIFFLTGAGKDIREKEDSFFFVHYSASNSISFSARLAQTGDESAVTLCGIMFRSSEQTNAPFAFVGASLPYVYYIRRTATGESCTQENHHRVKAPGLFLLLKHEHSNFVAGFSIDNTNWTWFATNSVSMQDQSFVPGFALCSGKSNAPIRANFDSLKTGKA